MHTEVRTSILLSLICLLAAATAGAAQQSQSLVDQLNSPDWPDRHRALFELNQLPLSEIPPEAAERAIQLLEQEATSPRPDPDVHGEGFGEYLIQLVKFVLRLRDPASLRGLALLGIQVNREAKDFVASQGSASLGFLEEGFGHSDPNRHAVIITWAIMLSTYPDGLTDEERSRIRLRLLESSELDPLAFAWAARIGELVAAIPVLETIESESTIGRVRSRAASVLEKLEAKRADTAPLELLDDLSRWLGALCIETRSGPRKGACQSLDNILATARRHMAAGRDRPAKNSLDAFIKRARGAENQGAFSSLEAALLIGNAEALL